MKEQFVGEAMKPVDATVSAGSMSVGEPGLPSRFLWRGVEHGVSAVLEKWKEAGECRHGSGERYVRRHWFRIRTEDGLEMKVYFERQARGRTGSRWRIYSVLEASAGKTNHGT